MGKRGPAPQPTYLKILKEVQPDRINRNAPKPRTGEPEPPEMTDAARAIWDYTLAELRPTGMASPLDRDALAAYCEAVVTHRRATKLLAESEVLVRGREGNIVRNPAVQIQRDAAMQIKAFGAEFGLTPRARAEIRLPDQPSDDERDRIFGSG